MNIPVIVDAVRTPFGARDGSFRDTHPQDLAAEPLKALKERNSLNPELVEDIIYGCVLPVKEQGLNIGRLAPLIAGWGDQVPGVQLNRMCGSGQQAVNFATQAIMSGQHDVVVAGGVENMTRVPMGSDYDSETGVTETYFEHVDERTTQYEASERIAEAYDISRRDVDEIAVDSHQRWKQAADKGWFDGQLVPVETELDGESITVETDEHPRPDTDLETLSELPVLFREEGDGVHHAGNSSGVVDGASAMLITSESYARDQGWKPLARVVQTEVVGSDPVLHLTGPIPATESILEKTDLDLSDIDLFEVNEAFASVVAAWLDETGASWEKTNVNGGAIAHGHPLGATGSALITKLAHELHRTDKDYALSTMCIGFGMGIATIIERM